MAVFVAVSLLHALAAVWIERHRSTPPRAPVHVPVQVALLKPERIERAAPPAPSHAAAAPKPAAHRAHREAHEAHALHAIAPPQPHPAAPAQAASAPAADAASAAAASAAAASGAAAAAASQAGTANAAAGNGQAPTAPNTSASHGAKFSIPPSGDLQYETFYNGVRNQPGTIHWISDGQHYEMVVSVPLPFIGTFSWTSQGHVDAFGLAPDQYSEKRGHRAADVTTFNRTDKQIHFTRTPTAVALPDGAQDRFSMVMQLASLVRGDPEAYRPGVTREFYVADNDSAEAWPVMTIGDEPVQTDHGVIMARHFMRMPRHEGDKRRIDVWLAPSLGWLPVRLVQTEPNGSEFELLWNGPPTMTAGNGADASNPSNASSTQSAPSAANASSATSAATDADAPTAAPATAPASEPAPASVDGSSTPAAPAPPSPEPPNQPQ